MVSTVDDLILKMDIEMKKAKISMARLRSFRGGDMEVISYVDDAQLASVRAMAAQLRQEGYAFEIRRVPDSPTDSIIVRRKTGKEVES